MLVIYIPHKQSSYLILRPCIFLKCRKENNSWWQQLGKYTDLRDGVWCHLMTICIEVLCLAVVSPFMWHIECGRNGTSIWISATLLKYILIQPFVEIIDSIIKSKQHYLRNFFSWQVAWIMMHILCMHIYW